jgi:hypothetical protein
LLSGGINEVHGLDHTFFEDTKAGVTSIIYNLIKVSLLIRGIFTQDMSGHRPVTYGPANTHPNPDTCLLAKGINN